MPDISDLATSDVVGFTGRGGIASVADGEITVQNDAGTNAFTIDVNGSAELQVVDNEIGVPAGDSLSVYNVGGPGEANYERLRVWWDSNVAYVTTQAGGTGTARQLEVESASYALVLRGASEIYFYQGNNLRTRMTSTALRPQTGGVMDLGTTSFPWRDVFMSPSSSLSPSANGDLCIEATNNTTLTFKYKGSDGVVRSGTVTLS